MADALGSGRGVKIGNPQQLSGVTVKKPSPGLLLVPVRGPRGRSGASSLEVFEHIQTVSQTTWTITHDLGRDPIAIQVYDSNDELMSEWSVQFTIPNEQIRLGFDIDLSGRARLI